MSAATADRNTVYQGTSLVIALLAASTVLYAGCLAVYNSAGYLEDGTEAAAKRFAGVVREANNNTGGSAGDVTVDLYQEGEFAFTSSSLTQADIGKPVFLIDNQTVGKSDHASVVNFIYVGTITKVNSATECMVQIDPRGDPAKSFPGAKRQITFAIAGTNAAAYNLAAAAAKLGGSDFYVTSVESVEAYVTSGGASAGLKVLTTNYTLASGVITGVGNESANTMVMTVTGYLRGV